MDRLGPELVANALGDTLTPSAVSVAEDGAVLVGRAAADRLVTHPDRSVASFKRWMGSSAGARLAGRFYRAEELSALVLRALKEDAEARTGGAIGEAVISVPAYFSDPQRKATLDAARLAGIAVERLVNEPTAAALAHGLDSVEEGRFLILDLGGGTFDVSLLHKFEGVMEVRASAGDSHLGGDDFRDALVALIARRHGVDPDKLARTDLARLMREAERIKHALSAQNSAAYEIALADETRRGEVAPGGIRGGRRNRCCAVCARRSSARSPTRASIRRRSTRSCWSAARRACRWCARSRRGCSAASRSPTRGPTTSSRSAQRRRRGSRRATRRWPTW